ncbi:MAG: polyprenyl synthetase family protein [Caenibius sp.]
MTVRATPPGELADEMQRVADEVDAAFDAFLPVPTDARARLVQAMRYAVIGAGKRLRPLLLMATAQIYGVGREHAIRAGCAVEAIHTYSLIHDDLPCMDDDDLRRGRPSVHKAFDEATAVLAGDSAARLCLRTALPARNQRRSVHPGGTGRALAQASGANGMAGGQMMDMVAETQSFDLPTITRLQQLKTGALLDAAVEMGAILGHAAPDEQLHLRGYARDIGLAFQIVDDLIDHEGDELKAGKALRKDEAAGKQTFITLLGAERAREQAHMLTQQAIGHLAQHGPEADMLRALARFIVERDH